MFNLIDELKLLFSSGMIWAFVVGVILAIKGIFNHGGNIGTIRLWKNVNKYTKRESEKWFACVFNLIAAPIVGIICYAPIADQLKALTVGASVVVLLAKGFSPREGETANGE